MPLERVPGPPHVVTALQQTDLTVYEATLSTAPSGEWRAAFLRPPARLITTQYTPELGRVDLIADRVIFRTTPAQLDGWLRRIDQWIAYANSVVEG
jgi:hypothetical protein